MRLERYRNLLLSFRGGLFFVVYNFDSYLLQSSGEKYQLRFRPGWIEM